MYHYCSHIYTVPPPDMAVTAAYTTPLYAGSSLTLTCTVTLDPNVDKDETITTSWSGPSYISGERFLVTAASGSGSTYTSTLTISSLTVQDAGTYTCVGMVNEQHVTASANHTLSTIRKARFYRVIYILLFHCENTCCNSQ